MYQQTPTAAELAPLGLTPDDYEFDDVEVWPENMPAVRLFRKLATQWVRGFSGTTGLRYEALPFLFDLHGIAPDERREVFDALRVMEIAALREMRAG